MATKAKTKISTKLSETKAAIYVRVSTQYQIDKASLPVQREELTNYAKYALGIEQYEIFEDAGFSAKNTERPAYQQMMSRLRMGEFTHLLVWKIDRISRNLLDFTNMFQELKRLGVTFVSKNEQFDTSTAMGEAMLKIILVFAELERNMTSERVSAVMINMANNGVWNGGRVPYGYSYSKDTRQFTINREEAAIVRLIFKQYIETKSLLKVANMLNEQGFRSRQGKEWSAVTVHKIITNIFYKGDYRYNYRDEHSGKRDWSIKDSSEWVITENHHDPIVTDEQWAEANNLLKRNYRGGYRRYDSYSRKNVHILAGLLKCGYCGANMVANKDARRVDGWRPSKYSCSLRHRSNGCPNKYTSDPAIAPFILCYVSNMMQAAKNSGKSTTLAALEKKLLKGEELSDVKHIQQDCLEQFAELLKANKCGVEYQSPYQSKSDSDLPDERALLENERSSKERALNRLKTLYLYRDEEMSEREFVTERQAIVSRIEAIDARLTELAELEQSTQTISDAEFISRASYFLIAQNLLSRRQSFSSLLSKLDETVMKEFLNNIISQIVVKDGIVLSITFKNGATHTFLYE